MQYQEQHLHTDSLIRDGDWEKDRQFHFHFMLLKHTVNGLRRLRVRTTVFLQRQSGNMPAGRVTRSIFFPGRSEEI